uniref:Uncharacterized protein n=1 Tax=Arundo donax TaxID=35708 RepID=A0A0A9G3D9_ARUDO
MKHKVRSAKIFKRRVSPCHRIKTNHRHCLNI